MFPLIDAFGQYVHKDWPGKIHAAADIAPRKTAEDADLAGHPGPGDWDSYGGWKGGPQRPASGRFRAEKLDGRWWLVDPEGRLFWSHGIDCVRGENSTPITDRENWFAALPAAGEKLSRFYGHGNWAPHGYYQGKSYETFNFTGANLWRKYGDDWNQVSAGKPTSALELGHEHHRQLVRRVGHLPAQDALRGHGPGRRPADRRQPRLLGQILRPVRREFCPSAREGMAAERKQAVGDPWCLGYFVGNELSWGDETSLAAAALASPADQPAKKAFLADLKAKYGDDRPAQRRLGHASRLVGSPAGNRTRARREEGPRRSGRLLQPDCRAVLPRLPRRREGGRPRGLYLGCRFAWTNDLARPRGRQILRRGELQPLPAEPGRPPLAAGVDRPVIIGEFHFGALDRGMFHTGLVPTASQEERAAAYTGLRRKALANPLMVGTHWFQYGDQRPPAAATARTTRSALSTSATRPTRKPSRPAARWATRSIRTGRGSQSETACALPYYCAG